MLTPSWSAKGNSEHVNFPPVYGLMLLVASVSLYISPVGLEAGSNHRF